MRYVKNGDDYPARDRFMCVHASMLKAWRVAAFPTREYDPEYRPVAAFPRWSERFARAVAA